MGFARFGCTYTRKLGNTNGKNKGRWNRPSRTKYIQKAQGMENKKRKLKRHIAQYPSDERAAVSYARHFR